MPDGERKAPRDIQSIKIFLSATIDLFPPCVLNGSAVTRTFQILYRNEEINLDSVANFKIHAIVENGKVGPKNVPFLLLHLLGT